ncbi:TPA: BREX-1 system phosphatase PglZ type A [Salmonella enterica subsp. enterica serovar Typhimurium]|uniref:BREX-1 system phosphatase PglZ type A n=2 Tax=Salmonella enterica TaxID=28901 RepID=A0A709IVI4_SALTM|nr:BREX-1 system phosphatase PglZ type A [Salmonella enterica subsp. enterica serovar Typhimurium]HAF8563588.1 BREX-1 system phosphatase PglZ type A [Salmonella enterica]EDM1877839.1 BREX-1 system phosphatase PglZ type A [Salmonella enterica subsp. enterica serovar Typhimurium]EDM2656929.1 BREX-1 system phosphatase PglZ type A [Salmonella enterica subsp. enterica serovar Typhimurium]HAB6568753.1 BREX-1 system phosphatase PglZ type A [Salmonella enterica subsp. enterica serovar Typhimurium]
MQNQEFIAGLKAKFAEHRIVFWHDPDKRFLEELDNLELENVTLLDMADQSQLAVKKRIEIDEPEQQFLLWFPHDAPPKEFDWLLDIRLYSTEFHADFAAITLNTLGIPQLGLREHIQRRKAFFSTKRLSALKGLVTEQENEASLDKKMVAVIAGVKTAKTEEILFSLITQYVNQQKDDDSDLENTLAMLKRHDLEGVLWDILNQEMGYQAEHPTLENLILKLFCTDLSAQADPQKREWLEKNVLATPSGRASALAFMVTWRADRRYKEAYDYCAQQMQDALRPEDQYRLSSPYDLHECETTLSIEQTIIHALVTQLLEESTTLDREAFKKLLSERQSKYWCQTRQEYCAIYDALRQAERLLNLRNRHIDGFHYQDSATFWKAYCEELFRFDQAYRLFNEYALLVHSKGAMILKSLDDYIEALYSNWYLAELSRSWNKVLETENRMQEWRIAGVPRQQNFYNEVVKPQFNNPQIKRVFVIISDALRYEVAEELGNQINTEKRFTAELRSQLGVLPSYTQLGMAALLPHDEICYQPGSGDIVYADGLSTSGTPNRDTILKKYKGMAVKSDDLLKWKNQQGRDLIRDYEVVYIWHNTIDAMGDSASTEEKTFEACRNAVVELKDLVTRVINRLHGTRIIVTADHGFLFQQQPLSGQDKTTLQIKPDNTIKNHKRFIIGHQLPADDFCWKGKVADTAGVSDNSEFLIPKGIQRFHFSGGARFVHGGAMLQEVCVPVLQVKALQKTAAEKQPQRRPVDIVKHHPLIKLVNNIDKVSLLQTHPVGELYEPRTLNIFIVDNANNVVSGKERICFDSDNNTMEKRVRDVTLKLIGANFNRRNEYWLILEDAQTETGYQKYPVIIDLAFQDDFF